MRGLEKAIERIKEPDSEFVRELKKLRGRCNLTNYGLASETDHGPTHVRRIMSGEIKRPARYIVLRIGKKLMAYSAEITERDVDRLLRSAGYPPIYSKRKFRLFR